MQAGSWAVEGIGEDFIPENANMSFVTDAFEIDDAESFAVARELLSREGILGGSSTGTLLAGALRYCRAQTKPKRVVTFVCDSGNKYLSKMYNDFWMAEQGFVQRPPQGDLSDLISHRYEAGEVISVGPDDTLLTAFKRMRSADFSQVPVVDERGRAIGILDESDVLVKVHRDPSHFNELVKNAMSDRLETFSPKASIPDLLGGIRSRSRRHRHGWRQVSRSHHADRFAFLFASAHAERISADRSRIFLGIDSRKGRNGHKDVVVG